MFFAEPSGKSVSYSHKTLEKIKRWFWKSCFSERYSSQTRKTTKADIAEIKKLKEGKASVLGDFSVKIEPEFFAANQFRLASAVTRTFILLLAQKGPRSFLSGSEVDLEKVLQQYNRSEFHHIFPRAYLNEIGRDEAEVNALANFCFINSAENKQIGKKKPSLYVSKMPSPGPALQAVLDHALCEDQMFNDDFVLFIERRSALLSKEANRLMGT